MAFKFRLYPETGEKFSTSTVGRAGAFANSRVRFHVLHARPVAGVRSWVAKVGQTGVANPS